MYTEMNHQLKPICFPPPLFQEEHSMFKKLLSFFKKPQKGSHKEKQAGADEVRKYAKTVFVTPARRRGEKRVTFTARDVHQGMKLTSKYPLVCASIDAKKFLGFARVSLVKREGIKQGATAKWTFKL
jgi:hypothetical protein